MEIKIVRKKMNGYFKTKRPTIFRNNKNLTNEGLTLLILTNTLLMQIVSKNGNLTNLTNDFIYNAREKNEIYRYTYNILLYIYIYSNSLVRLVRKLKTLVFIGIKNLTNKKFISKD